MKARIMVHKNDLKITLSHNTAYHNSEHCSNCGLKQTTSDNEKMKKKRKEINKQIAKHMEK